MQKRLLGIVLVVISLMIVSCDWWWYYEYYVVNNYNEPVTFKFTRVDRYYKNKKDTTIIIKPLENPKRTDPSSHVSLTPLAIF